MEIDRKRFFSAARADPFGGRLGQGQVDGMNAILDHWQDALPQGDGRWLAYMLATVFHETGFTMRPLREGYGRSDAQTVARLDEAFASGRLPSVTTPYWRADRDGKCWFGRGLVQITHKANYDRLGRAIGLDLVADPGLALRMDVAVRILFFGMTEGLFTGRRLAAYFNRDREDWTGARAIVNGRDRAEAIAGYGRSFWSALQR
ncbi:glycoside hydrolase family 19 protein [Agrobacterium sp. ES01]|uniref:glycoside hydrolase family 19 protein n=1 Tax=Agrobacterium sp. ES01 TaxID=3420714 RepID=UPI003D0CBBF2